jgi:ABC-type sugar transport system substrate-binding protein
MEFGSERAREYKKPRLAFTLTAIISLVAACSGATPTAAPTTGPTQAQATAAVTAAATTAVAAECKKYDPAVLDPRPVKPSLNFTTPTAEQLAKNNSSAAMGGQPDQPPVWYDTVKVTPEQVNQICNLHLKAVYLDWADALYNQIFRSAMRQTLQALGIDLIRITSFSFDPNGLAGNLASVLPLKPDIIFTGGTIDTKQYAALMQPAVDAGITIISWGVAADGWEIGQGKQITSLIGYDWYDLGQNMAKAVCAKYTAPTNLGWLHWINNISVIHLREQGFLDGLKACPNITVVSDGGPADPAGNNSGYSDPNAAENDTTAFLVKHPEVTVIFAPWEDPPGLGEESAIKSAGKEGKIDIVTMDLGTAGAVEIAAKGTITVDMAQDIYDGGRVEALIAGLNAIGAPVPAFVNVPTMATSIENLKDAWDFMHGPEFPCPVANCPGGS